MALSLASAHVAMAAESMQQPDTPKAKACDPATQDAIEPGCNASASTPTQTESPQTLGEAKLSTRIYHLKYVTGAHMRAMIDRYRSEKGQIAVLPANDAAPGMSQPAASEECTRDGLPKAEPLSAGGETLILQDSEQKLEFIDRIIAAVDVPPTQVLIEALIVEVTLKKDCPNEGINFGMLSDQNNQRPGVNPNGAVIKASAECAATNSLSQPIPTSSADAEYIKFGGKSLDFVEALKAYGDPKILASPRILVLNRQLAEVRVGKLSHLRLRPFVSSDGMIRLELSTTQTTAGPNSLDESQDEATVTTNVLASDGLAIAVAGMIHAKENAAEKKEWVVCLTPHIWKP
jgi:type II secretory pathway component GspD/PulD (secretin)